MSVTQRAWNFLHKYFVSIGMLHEVWLVRHTDGGMHIVWLLHGDESYAQRTVTAQIAVMHPAWLLHDDGGLVSMVSTASRITV